jgi:hypothetical protein
MKRNQYAALAGSMLAVVIPICVLFMALFHDGFVPLLTNSISFDAKVRDIKEQKINQADFMALGSSITLNNLSSAVMKDSLNMSFFNFSSWGLQINDIYNLAVHYVPEYKPKYLLICSSVTDFENAGNPASISNYLNTNDYIRRHAETYFYIKNYNSVLDIRDRKRTLDKLKSDSKSYDYLGFDEGGGVLLNIPRDKISALRWNLQGGFPTDFTNRQYRELDSLGNYLNGHHIVFIFVQTPIKKLYTDGAGEGRMVNSHFNTCKTIVEQRHGVYLNFNADKEFSGDSLFADQFHLTAEGATFFTKELAHHLKYILADH